MPDDRSELEAPQTLVAIVRAARLSGDRDLERAARRDLRDRFGIELTFNRNLRQGVGHAG